IRMRLPANVALAKLAARTSGRLSGLTPTRSTGSPCRHYTGRHGNPRGPSRQNPAMPELRFDVDVVPPYRLRWHELGGGPVRAMWLHAQPVAIRLEQEADDAPVTAHVASTAPLGPVADLAREAARHMACADDDLAAFRRAVAGDPPMAALADRFPGLKPLRILDLWTALLRALVSQQISGAAARAIE